MPAAPVAVAEANCRRRAWERVVTRGSPGPMAYSAEAFVGSRWRLSECSRSCPATPGVRCKARAKAQWASAIPVTGLRCPGGRPKPQQLPTARRAVALSCRRSSTGDAGARCATRTIHANRLAVACWAVHRLLLRALAGPRRRGRGRASGSVAAATWCRRRTLPTGGTFWLSLPWRETHQGREAILSGQALW